MADTANEQRTPEEIREDIEETRGELGDTVEALAGKADVKAQAKQRAESIKGNVTAKAEELKQKAQDVTPESAAAQGGAVKQKAQENPLPFAVGGALVAGFILGRLTARG